MKIFARIKKIASNLISKFKTLSFKKKLIVILITIIVLFVIFQLFSNATKKPGYTLGKVTRGSVTEIVSETGNIVSNNKTEVFSPTNGVITEVLITNGEVVNKDQDLFKVESSATQQEKQAAYSTYLLAQSALGSAKSTLSTYQSGMFSAWDTYKTLAEGDTYENADGSPKTDQRTLPQFHIAEKNWLAAEAKYKDQQTVIAQAQAQVSSSWLLYQATQNSVVKAPMAGSVANLSVTAGNSVEIKSLTNTKPVLVISSIANTEVVLEMGEDDIAKIQNGQEVIIDANAVDDKKYKGKVVRVDEVGTKNAGVIKYSVYVEVTNADERLKSGMTIDADIKTKNVANVLVVPNSAIKPHGGGKAVRVVDPKTKKLIFVPVKIGVRGESKTEIVSGVNESQEIVVSLDNDNVKRSSLF